MDACVIFNPTACGERAQQFRRFLTEIGPGIELRPTTGPASARALAREAVEAGHRLIIAAGGDGTAFEVLNGVSDAPGGLARAVLGVLPLGTANVLAHELRIPLPPQRAWETLCHGTVQRIDCGAADFHDAQGRPCSAHFAVVAGAGLDARAVQLVEWSWKKRVGKLAYIAAALRAWLSFPDRVRCAMGGVPCRGRAVLAGNGRLYAGDLPVFLDGGLNTGRLHVRLLEKVTPAVLARCLLAYATGRWWLEGRLRSDTVAEICLEADEPVPLQLDGEFAGWLPATLRILPGALQVLRPRLEPEGPRSDG
jgi:diacylglycerol kinase family enzyme